MPKVKQMTTESEWMDESRRFHSTFMRAKPYRALHTPEDLAEAAEDHQAKRLQSLTWMRQRKIKYLGDSGDSE